MWLFPVTIASIIIRSAVVKFLKKEHKGKIITLMYAGTLSGFILTVSFFQKVSRFKKLLLSKLAIQQAASSKWILRYKKAADARITLLLLISTHLSKRGYGRVFLQCID